jgi:hypothetical protein
MTFYVRTKVFLKKQHFMWNVLKVHEAPCVVLVINDNLYGLMFALS